MRLAGSILLVLVGLVALVPSVWLLSRWFRFQHGAERWLAVPGCVPLLAVAAHWWWYPSDSVVAHIWLAAFQVLAFLFVAKLSSVLARTSRTASVGDHYVGLATTALAAIFATMFVMMYFEHSGLLDEIAPAFMANPPRWWWTISVGWIMWFFATIVLLPSSAAMRRGWSVGYVGIALVVSLFAEAHWFFRYELGDELGPASPSADTVAVLVAASILGWLFAAYRIVKPVAMRWIK